MRQSATRGIYEYWNSVRGSRIAPRRYEIEPSEISSLLSATMIVEHPGHESGRIRIAGTKAAGYLGEAARGRSFLELWTPEDAGVLQGVMKTIAEHGGVGVFTFEGRLGDAQTVSEFEMILLPLTHLERSIDRMLGAVALVKAAPWLETRSPTAIKLTSSEVIWPDGRPYLIAKSFAAQANIVADSRKARLVRSDRRQFLVYDGGLQD